jgi:DNA-binding CsgD family transcriptional regulator
MILSSVFDGESTASHGGFLHVSRPSGQRPFQVHISPLSQKTFGGYSPEKLALLFVFDPEQRFGTVEELLRRMYGLTPAEAKLAGMLAKGMSQKEAAEVLNVKPSTIHTHMKHIFSKTDCKRQGELITVIFNGLAALKNL